MFALTLGTLTANASERFIERFNSSIGSLDRADAAAFNAVLDSIDERAYPVAEMRLAQLLDGADIDDKSRALLLANLGVLKAVNAGAEEGILDLSAAIELMEKIAGPFDRDLIELLMTKAAISRDVEAFEVAEEALRRAQHIAHRQDGVYTPNQLPILEQLTLVHLSRGLVLEADREQRLNIRIVEQLYGEDSPEIVPLLHRVGNYFANRGNTFLPPAGIDSNNLQSQAEAFTAQYRFSLFRESVELYERAIAIVETNFGPDNLRLVPLLKGLATARLQQGTATTYAERAIERATRIVVNNPGTDISDHATALVEQGDLYTATGDRHAEQAYLEAWNLLSSDPALEDLRDELFNTPKRIYPKHQRTIALTRRPISVDKDDPLFANVEFTVVDDGRVANVKVLEGNVPNEEKNSLRRDIRTTRYRPRIVDGELVATEGLIIRQYYQVIAPGPEFSASIETGPRLRTGLNR